MRELYELIIAFAQLDGRGIDEIVWMLTKNLWSYVNAPDRDVSKDISRSSISKFQDPIFRPIQILIPAKVHTKGCGRRGRLPKSSSRFKSHREVAKEKIIATNSRRCIDCRKLSHNRRSCSNSQTVQDNTIL